MPVLYVTSDQPRAGKTSLAVSLLARIRDTGRRACYFKPFSLHGIEDKDNAFIQQMGFGGHSFPVGTPLTTTLDQLTHGDPVTLAQEAQKAADSLITEAELLVVEGPSLRQGDVDLSVLCSQLVRCLSARVAIVIQYHPGLDAEELTRVARLFGETSVSILVNCVGNYRGREVRDSLAQATRSVGAVFLGALPQDRLMLGVTVAQVAEHLHGQWVIGREKADALVEHFLIGGNVMDSGRDYFGRNEGEAIIVRGDRPDIQLVALTTSASCLILTGGHQPTEYVYHEVEQLEVPLLVVQGDTQATAAALGSMLERSNPYHPQKVARFQELLERCGDVRAMEGLIL